MFIEAYRLALDKTLWELPRGQADLGDRTPHDTARRELQEETGLAASDSVVLGKVYPDSGLSGDAVNVVHVIVEDLLPAGNPEYALLRWLSLNEVQAAIADGRIRDGITLSALMLEQAQNVSEPSRKLCRRFMGASGNDPEVPGN